MVIILQLKNQQNKLRVNLNAQEKNTDKYITFSVPTKGEHDNNKTTTYKLKFIDSFRFMSTLLSKLVDNLSEIYI